MGWRVCVIIRGSYEMTVRSPRILEQPDAIAQISKVREARARSGGDDGATCVGLDWLSVKPDNVLAAYVVDEDDVGTGPADVAGSSVGAYPSPSTGEPFV